MLKLLEIYYGPFSEIENLYSRFQREQSKIKVVLEISNGHECSRNSFLSLYRHLAELFPTLRLHSCCEEWDAAPLVIQQEEGVSVKRIGDPADFPHLLEHLMVDLQCMAGGMKSCSGITCGWKKPESRFDLYVECDDPRIGIFAACFGINLINNFLAGNPVEDDHRLLMTLVKLVDRYPETKSEISRLATALNETVENINRGIDQLSQFHFFLPEGEVEEQG